MYIALATGFRMAAIAYLIKRGLMRSLQRARNRDNDALWVAGARMPLSAPDIRLD
jgi:hypothetical protein